MNISDSSKRKITADSPLGDVIYRNGRSELVKFNAKDIFNYVATKQLSMLK